MQTHTNPISESYVRNLIAQSFAKFKANGSMYYSTHAEERITQMVKITFNERYRVRGGTCKFFRTMDRKSIRTLEIILSTSFMEKTDSEKHFQLVSHELAHGYHAFIRGKSDHGSEWRAIHRAMGGDGERCHSEEVIRNKVKRHEIKDIRNGKTYTVSTRRWNFIKQFPHYSLVRSYIAT